VRAGNRAHYFYTEPVPLEGVSHANRCGRQRFLLTPLPVPSLSVVGHCAAIPDAWRVAAILLAYTEQVVLALRFNQAIDSTSQN